MFKVVNIHFGLYYLLWRLLYVDCGRIYFFCFGWNILYESLRPILSSALLKFSLYFMSGWSISCGKQGTKDPYHYYTILFTITLRLHYVNVWFPYWGSQMLDAYTNTHLLMNWHLYHYAVSLIDSVTDLDWIFFQVQPSLLSTTIFTECIFSYFYFEIIC